MRSIFNTIRKITHQNKYGEKGIITPEGLGTKGYLQFYQDIFSDPNFRAREEEIIVVDETKYIEELKAAVKNLSQGKALSRDLLPITISQNHG